MSTVAGVIINLSGREARERYCVGGAYSCRQVRRQDDRAGWGTPQELAIADYLALAAGDLVFFFEQRQIFGIGRVVQMPMTARAALCNYPRSWDLSVDSGSTYLWEHEPNSDLSDHPFVVFFEPEPAWYTQGIDMDEALASDTHGYVRQLPFFAGVSFARFDDFEAAHLASLIRKANRSSDVYPSRHQSVHERAKRYLDQAPSAFSIDIDGLVRKYSERGLLRHEALLEAWLVDAFRNRWDLVSGIVGRPTQPTFVGHQVPASPFKPHEYIDRIDLLAYDIEKPTPGSPIPVADSYVLAEFKKADATVDDVRQTLKYVDWVAHEYQGGDYTGIAAFVASAGYPAAVQQVVVSEGKRSYVRPRRPYGSDTWDSLRLLQYRVADEGPAIMLDPV